MHYEIEHWLTESKYGEIATVETLGGGCINELSRLELRDGGSLILKKNHHAPDNFFAAEATGLSALSNANALRVPSVIHQGSNFLLLEDLGQGQPSATYWEQLGMGLAKLHNKEYPQFGFTANNFCGETAQDNTLYKDGFEFFANRRIRALAKTGLEKKLLSSADMDDLDFIASRLAHWIPLQPAVLIHGDLWSGNIHCDNHGNPALIDPATYWGWAEAELAMTELFAGFDKRFYDSYANQSAMGADWRERVPLYNLYHLLNHLLLFGNAYLAEIRNITARFAKRNK